MVRYKMNRVECINIRKPVSIDPKGYIRVRDEKGYICSEHKLVWIKHKGDIPKGFMIHHKNEDKKDNRIENLLLVTKEHPEIKKRLKKNGKRTSN